MRIAQEKRRHSEDGPDAERAMTIADLNAAERPSFVAAVGFAFESSPWIAELASEQRPFADLDALSACMNAIVAGSSLERRIALIAAHPDLAGRVAREGRLTPASTSEQTSAGLDRLSAEEIVRFDVLNAEYRERFGFPFVICVRQQTKSSILEALERRAKNDRNTEVATALSEIGKIARLRLHDVIE
ncbi:MAG: 2-oxo-4-hydroxy-4-carboxy-5-ureidoimidazoline decarboxylase [Vulcanimicrobiaceae bacterium]